jgi:hypothetical protein
MPTPEEIADNTGSQLKPHKYPSIYVGHANGPSHKIDTNVASEALEEYESKLYEKYGRDWLGMTNEEIKARNDLSRKAEYDNNPPEKQRLFHGSPNKINVGDKIIPTETLQDAAEKNGMLEDIDDDPDIKNYRDGLSSEKHAFATSTVEDAHFYRRSRDNSTGHVYEVEPITYTHTKHGVWSDAIQDPTDSQVDEVASPTGYRVVQEVTPKNER